MSRNIVFEGWLTKSPPNRRIWRTVSSTLAWHFAFVDRRWRRRWFALRQSGELPGQYFLDYYADRNCRRLKGTIDLDLCEQVDAGLHMERHGQAPFNPSIRGSVFTIQTQRRTYHLEADCEAEMEKWVDAICRVCGLRATLDVPAGASRHSNVIDPSSGHATINMSDNSECPDGTGPYIPISECITGVRAQDEQRHFTFEERNIINTRGHQYTSHPQIRVNSELSENDSNLSEDDDGSLHASHQNLPDWSVTKTFTKLSISPKKNGPEEGPPVPPRPPKTFAGRSRDTLTKDPFQGPKIQEPTEVVLEPLQHSHQRLRVPRRMSQGAPSSPRSLLNARCPEEEEDFAPAQSSLQYCNLPTLPPAVDRALKPRHSTHSIGHSNAFVAQGTLRIGNVDDIKQDALQYLDLDLHPAKPAQTKEKTDLRKKTEIAHGQLSMSSVDREAYKTVDFLKTEAFNITRQDAEASRSFQY
ncbi:uncharacterized protein LOC111360654 isoform X1 [Spodoptera litura]|uniref:Uncharacterized protein LOC111360654 isoform X1 n=1 Tax=Spodoptera litura TaxID=69820 RepID=A0A9J7EK34_SPOLT|nr:uncharacterized protein LOC111360654 isoform X1 [Spodoptera litura]